MKQIFIDMDGVLADLDSAFEKWSGYHPDLHPNRGVFFDKFLPEYVTHNGFYTQDKMPKAEKLVTYLKGLPNVNLAILTSAGHFYNPVSDVVDQKKKWIERNFPELNRIPFCVTTSGVDKADFAHENSFLIDDHEANIRRFIENDGNGFVYIEENITDCFNKIEDWLYGVHCVA